MYKYKKSKYLILVPAFNELKNLKKFIKKINKFSQLYVLDDCSTDKTDLWLFKNKIRYIRNKKNLGYEKNLLNTPYFCDGICYRCFVVNLCNFDEAF